jgi:predicted transcriptional regulator
MIREKTLRTRNWVAALPVTQFLADEQIVAAVYEALAKCWLKSRSRGRFGTSAEMVLRLVLKHVRN